MHKSKESIVWFNIKKKGKIPYTHNISRYEQFEVLGMSFDQHLKVNEHICRATSRTSSTLLLLLRLKRLEFDATKLVKLYQNLVLSKLTIGITVWVGRSTSNLTYFDQVRRRAVRMGVISDYNPTGDYIILHDGHLMINFGDNEHIRSKDSSRRVQTMPKDPCEVVILDVKEQSREQLAL